MSILNIKNFPDDLHEKLRERAKREHRSVSQEVVHLLARALEPRKPDSILELRGLGKSLWADIDGARHVAEERESWD
jgi:plasmid stability protein